MTIIAEYPPVTPDKVYNGLKAEIGSGSHPLDQVLNNNRESGNSYIDLFASLARVHGKLQSKSYAAMLGVDSRKLDGALECMTGMNVRDWLNEYLRLAACDLLEHTRWQFREVGKCLGMSGGGFAQFFRAYQHMQPFEYRSLKQKGVQRKRKA